MIKALDFVLNTKIYKRIFGSKYISPKLYFELNPINFLFQHRRNEKIFRYDTIVRLLAIENFFGKNDSGWNLYLKMQFQRQQNKEIKSLEDFKLDFIKLIKSFEANGFDSNHPIKINNNNHLADGSHRLACAIYFNLDKVFLKRDILNKKNVDFSIDWFRENNFTSSEIKIITDRLASISKKTRTPFMAIIWPCGVKYNKEILSSISDLYEIQSKKEIQFENNIAFEKYVRGMYSIDDIDDWKINKKLKFMETYHKTIFEILFIVEHPTYRKKKLNEKLIEVNIEAIKNKIRTEFKPKVANYFHDVLIHIGDNTEHTIHMQGITQKDLNIKEFLDSIDLLEYAILKTETPYMPKNFPSTYPLGKDLDILSSKKDFAKISSKLNSFCNKYSEKYTIKKFNEDNRYRVRFELNDFLCYQIDLISKFPGDLNIDLFKSTQHRIKSKGYYVLIEKFEILVRCVEYLQNKKKQHHVEFLKKVNLEPHWSLIKNHFTHSQIKELKKKICEI